MSRQRNARARLKPVEDVAEAEAEAKPKRERKARGPRKSEDDRLREIRDRKFAAVLALRVKLDAAHEQVREVEAQLAAEEPKLARLNAAVGDEPEEAQPAYAAEVPEELAAESSEVVP